MSKLLEEDYTLSVKISFTSLGCDKNLVDSEVMLGLIDDEGFQVVDDDAAADVIIVNTCCFINDAKEESIENILELSNFKVEGNCKSLIVTGCMAERYKDEIFKELPEVDGVVGTGSYERIIEVIKESLEGKKVSRYDSIHELKDEPRKRLISTPGYYEYIKIAEGCDNHCTYCIIPKLRGKYRSRKIENIVDEAKQLVAQGVKEIILVAQDTTRYGEDLYGKKNLPALLEELSKIEDLKWIRLFYCYPEEITDELIMAMKNLDKVCNYLDMPIQHANNNILRRMARRSSREKLVEVISKLRKEIPDIAIRTTLITGFPGETDEEFEDMLNFIKEMRFDRLGAFTYSQEEDTVAATFEDQVDEEVKEKRKDIIMETQRIISQEKSNEAVGRELDVMIDGRIPDEADIYCGRTYKDAPDVDGIIFVNSKNAYMSGDFIRAKVEGSHEYDLIGEELDEHSK